MPLSSTTKVLRIAKELTVQNKLGLHARPAAALVRKVQSFRSKVWIVWRGKRYDAGRLMELLTANLEFGSTFVLEAEGSDADAAAEQIEKLLLNLREAEARGEHS